MSESAADGSPRPDGPGQTVLVVDDEEGLRSLVCRTLRGEGYRTLEASHGAEALELVEASSGPVDLVVTDMVMPGMDGRELGRRLAQRWPTLPILYISAYDVNDIFRRGSPRSSAPFLQKPFAPDGLLTVVRGLLRDGGRRAEPSRSPAESSGVENLPHGAGELP
jgi:two-component system, cell cycle sensor histidine kinase and response regulator CckA